MAPGPALRVVRHQQVAPLEGSAGTRWAKPLASRKHAMRAADTTVVPPAMFNIEPVDYLPVGAVA